MSFEYSIIKDFYDCCSVPIKLINYEFEDLCKIGYTDFFDRIYPLEDIKINIKNCKDELINTHIQLKNDINYKVIDICKYNKKIGYFIIGPFRTNHITNLINKDITYKPLTCSNYLCNLILNIYEDKLKNQDAPNTIMSPYIRKAIGYIHHHYQDEISIDSICEKLDINKCYFCSLFKKYTGHTFSYFLNNFRVEKSKELLAKTDLSLLEVAFSVGFNNQTYYSIIFKKFTNQTPSQYRSSMLLKE
ncbi:AraC family transcriptional regulator [Romboutsia ilealis]|uniref:Helix-turn-helix transcriptional regulator n=1 Tax=Romboutsia faecis TaxID=2764597 RepID=A0ABR7JLS6_9FIRM|nr:AraC family transcriptional regulator [Romboutsia faecis]MBC5995556.1 helix-turn-helix transcriptional regulator [Romboutsia faecis]MRN23757.1 AraC family transcriptional regulator [Romboutsia ilealis]